jgi:hypothetical protein
VSFVIGITKQRCGTSSGKINPVFDSAPHCENVWGNRGVASRYGLDDSGVGVRVPVGSRIFSSPRHPDRLWGSPNLLSNGYQTGREADHSPPASAEVKKM